MDLRNESISVTLLFMAVAIFFFSMWAMIQGISDMIDSDSETQPPAAQICVPALTSVTGDMEILQTSSDGTEQKVISFENSSTVSAAPKNPDDPRVQLQVAQEASITEKSGLTSHVWTNSIGESIVLGGPWRFVSLGKNAQVFITVNFHSLETAVSSGENRVQFGGQINNLPTVALNGVNLGNVTMTFDDPTQPRPTQISCELEGTAVGGVAPHILVSSTFASALTGVEGSGRFEILATFDFVY